MFAERESAVPDDTAKVTTFVDTSPEEAFRIFTEEIDAWWRPGPRFRGGGSGSSLSFEEAEGERRLVERGEETFVIGRVLDWQPGACLRFEWRARNFQPGETTEVEVRFDAAKAGTRVTLEHRGWAAVRRDHPVRHGLEGGAFVAMIGMHWGELVTGFRAFIAGTGR